MYDDALTVKKDIKTNTYTIEGKESLPVGRNFISYWGMKTEDDKIVIPAQYYSYDQIDTAKALLIGNKKEYKEIGSIASHPNWTVVKKNPNIY